MTYGSLITPCSIWLPSGRFTLQIVGLSLLRETPIEQILCFAFQCCACSRMLQLRVIMSAELLVALHYMAANDAVLKWNVLGALSPAIIGRP